jgi:hypothetical protein
MVCGASFAGWNGWGTERMTDTTKPRKPCPACRGRGYTRCDCYPGDCICGWGDEECEECGGTGDANYDADEYYEDRDND